MRIIDADELIEHVWRDKLDSRELIAEMINNAPTIKEIPTNIPIDIFEKLISTGHWIAQNIYNCHTDFKCSECGYIHSFMHLYGKPTANYNYCPNCGCRMIKEYI